MEPKLAALGVQGTRAKHLVLTLAMMVTGVLLGPHVQLFAIAMCVPCRAKLPSIVRRFERFVADEQVDVQIFFEPFVRAMQASLGNETAYLLMDCTQAGPQCRTLFIGLAYHGTVLPLIWKTVKGEFQRDLLTELYPKFRYHKRVIVLGDAEFSNETVIRWFESKKDWHFVFRFQSNYRIRTGCGKPWLSAKALYEARGMKAGQVEHWDKVAFTKAHHIPGLTMTVHWDAEAKESMKFRLAIRVQYAEKESNYDKRRCHWFGGYGDWFSQQYHQERLYLYGL